MRSTDAVNTIVGEGAVLEGSFQVAEGIRVDGTLKGKLTSSGTLVVGVSGVVIADPIRVKNAIVAGRIEGTLEASRLVKLESSSHMIGDITAQMLIIEEGAVLRGICDAGSDREDAAVPKAEQATG